MKTVSTPYAPQPGGHYSQAIVHGDTVYLAGQLPVHPQTGETAAGSIADQTLLVLENMRAVLEASGSGVDHVLKVTIFVPDISLWPTVNEVYAEFFGSHRPARVVVPTRDLHHGCLIEIDAVAGIKD